MVKSPKKPEDVKDEPGAEERFKRGVKRALETPPKPHEEMKADRKVLGVVVSPPISEAFAFGAFDGSRCAFGIIDAKGDAVVPLEGDFVDVALQVMLADRVMRAVHLAFDDRMEAFCRIDMNEAAKSHIFISRVIDARMSAVIARWLDVDLAFIGHEIGRFVDAGVQVLFDVLRGDVGDVLGADFAATLNERHNSVLLRFRLAIMNVLLFAADIGFVAFDNLVASTDRAAFALGWRHRLANAHLKEPGCLVLHAEHAPELVRAHALLARSHQPERKEPFTKRNVAALHHGIGADGELLPAFLAMVVAGSWPRDWLFLRRLAHHRIWRQCLDGFRLLAKGASRPIRPALFFEMHACRVLVVKNRIGDVKHS